MNNDAVRETKFPTGTLVFGLILSAIAVLILSRSLLDWSIDAPLLLIALVALAGVVLIISGITSALKRSRHTNRDLPDELNDR